MLDNDNIMTAKGLWGSSEGPYRWKRLSKILLKRYSFHVATVHVCEHIPYKKSDGNKASPAQPRETAEDILKFVQKKVQ